MKGMVFDIQKFSLHDGPGIRTAVFLKGCPLRCFWCQNPEGLRRERELQFTSAYCVGCGSCFRVCPNGAHLRKDGKHVVDRGKCTLCGRCVEECLGRALAFTGKDMEVSEVVEAVLQDEEYYKASGGGVTLSGGEPLSQPDFSAAILEECRNRGIHTAMETALQAEWKTVARLLPYTDLFMIDIKVIDSEKHRRATGASNRRILENARRLSGTDIPLIVRVPVIPTVNDTAADARAVAELVSSFRNLRYLEFIPFHPLGEGKYRSLGLGVATEGLPRVGNVAADTMARIASGYRINVKGVEDVDEHAESQQEVH